MVEHASGGDHGEPAVLELNELAAGERLHKGKKTHHVTDAQYQVWKACALTEWGNMVARRRKYDTLSEQNWGGSTRTAFV